MEGESCQKHGPGKGRQGDAGILRHAKIEVGFTLLLFTDGGQQLCKSWLGSIIGNIMRQPQKVE